MCLCLCVLVLCLQVGYACVLIASKFVDKKPVRAADLAGPHQLVAAAGRHLHRRPHTQTRDPHPDVRDRQHVMHTLTHTCVLTVCAVAMRCRTVSMDLPDPTVCAFADRFATAGGIAMNSQEHAFIHFLLVRTAHTSPAECRCRS